MNQPIPTRPSKIPPVLRGKLAKAAGGSAITIAVALGVYFEGRPGANGQFKPYIDPVGIPTVCAGVTGPDVVMGKIYTEAECEALEAKHLAIAEAGAKRVLKNYDSYNKWRQAALIDFTYNAGTGALASSTMAKKFNAGDAIAGCMELTKWTKARVKGVLTTLKGLVIRRDVEMELCLYGFKP